MMTNADLKQIYYICKEIKLCEAELRELKHSSLTGSRIDGMPKSGRGDKVADRAIRIADLEAKESIEPQHISEAIGYRSLDRENWGR